MPKGTVDFERRIEWYARNKWHKEVYSDPVMITVLAIKTRPKRLYRKKDIEGLVWRPHKPDGSNTLKAVEDALQNAGVIRNDIQVVHSKTLNLFTEKNGPPRVEVWLEKAPVAADTCVQIIRRRIEEGKLP